MTCHWCGSESESDPCEACADEIEDLCSVMAAAHHEGMVTEAALAVAVVLAA